MSGNTNAATAGDASSGSATDASLGSTFVAVVVNNNGAKNNASAKNSHANNNSHGNNSHANNNKERPTIKSSSSSCACATDVYSTTSNATENSKRSLKRHRDETFREIDGLLESRDDLDTKSESFMDYDEEEDDDDTSASMSLGGFSMGSLGECLFLLGRREVENYWVFCWRLGLSLVEMVVPTWDLCTYDGTCDW